MGFELTPNSGDRGDPGVESGRSGSTAIGEDRRLLSSGLQVLARGALVCPGCALPVSPAPRMRPGAQLCCAYCAHAAAAIEFLAADVRDTFANDVVLVARVA